MLNSEKKFAKRVCIMIMAAVMLVLVAVFPDTAQAAGWIAPAVTVSGGSLNCEHVYGPALYVLEPTVGTVGKKITKCVKCKRKITEEIYGTGIYHGGYYVNGKAQTGVSGVIKIGTYYGKSIWAYLQNGLVTNGPTVEKNDNGWWYINKDGYVDFNYTGFAKNTYGDWYIKDGKVQFDGTSDIIKDTRGVLELNSWFYVIDSKVTYSYVIDGVSTNETVAKNALGWWYVKNGKVDFGPYLIDGEYRTTTIKKNDNGWWYIENGKVNFEYTGVAKNENGWWRIESGKVNLSYNGLASNDLGTWVIEGGKVNFNYNGTYTWNGKTYNISGGKVV